MIAMLGIVKSHLWISFVVLAGLTIISLVVNLALANEGKKPTYFVTKLAAIVAAVTLILALLVNCLVFVPEDYTGVRCVWGQIQTQLAPQGWSVAVPLVERVQLVHNRQTQNFNVQVWGQTTDKSKVFAKGISVVLKIAPERSAWLYANIPDAINGPVAGGDVGSAIKLAIMQLSDVEVTNHKKTEPLVREALNDIMAARYGENTVSILSVQIKYLGIEKDGPLQFDPVP